MKKKTSLKDWALLPKQAFLNEFGELRNQNAIRMMKERCRRDLPMFAHFFFPEICRLNWSQLHCYLFKRRLAKTEATPPDRRGELDVVLAPRGSAKSSLVSLVFPIHAMLYRTEFYIVLVSATERQAKTRLENIRAALTADGKFQQCYAEELNRLERETQTSMILNGVKMDVFSAGSELRGVTFGGWRPTWIVLDDVESGARVRRADYRDDLARWMSEVVENLGNGYTNLDLIGTLLHPDALPMRLAKRPDARLQKYRSILTEADHAGLWEEWRARLFDLSDPDRVATARKFFEERRGEMLKGAQALWPEKEDYYHLQMLRATRGVASFNQEKQNEPPAEGEAIFAPATLARFSVRGDKLVLQADPESKDAPTRGPERPEIPLASLRVFGFLDPAMGESRSDGKSGSSDFAAIATVGVDEQGFLHALDVWMDRAGPSRQIQQIFALHERWNYESFGIETNAFQKLLLDPLEQERERRRRQRRSWMLPVQGIRHRAAKVTRIAALEPLIRNGWLLFADDLSPEFMGQLGDFPHGRHDDGPDALQAAVALARSSGSKSQLAPAPKRGAGTDARSF